MADQEEAGLEVHRALLRHELAGLLQVGEGGVPQDRGQRPFLPEEALGPVEGVHRLGRVFQAHLAQGGLQAVVKLGEARGQGQGKGEGEGQDQTSSHPLTSLGARRLSLCMSCPTLASSRAVTPTKPPPTGRRRRSLEAVRR